MVLYFSKCQNVTCSVSFLFYVSTKCYVQWEFFVLCFSECCPSQERSAAYISAFNDFPVFAISARMLCAMWVFLFYVSQNVAFSECCLYAQSCVISAFSDFPVFAVSAKMLHAVWFFLLFHLSQTVTSVESTTLCQRSVPFLFCFQDY